MVRPVPAPVAASNACRRGTAVGLTSILDSSFYPRDAMLARVLAMAPCLLVFVTSHCSIETDE